MQLIDAAPLMHFPQSLQLRWQRRVLHFRRPATTSRGALMTRTTYIIEANGTGLGECCIMPGLLPEPTEAEMDFWCKEAELLQGLPAGVPSPICFGLECAILSALQHGKARWDTPFSRGEAGIPIHHLVWMADIDSMLASIHQGIQAGFSCVKLKVGAWDFKKEFTLLREAHQAFPEVEFRVDANGAFTPQEAPSRLDSLAAAGVSCIEQPIRPGQWPEMAGLCRNTPLPIALDEELIGTSPQQLFEAVQPQALVIKPSLHGGLLAAQDWARYAEAHGIPWWVNSALESNIGLTALAEWCAYAAPGMMQALGKGNLFVDDTPHRVSLVGNQLKIQEI